MVPDLFDELQQLPTATVIVQYQHWSQWVVGIQQTELIGFRTSTMGDILRHLDLTTGFNLERRMGCLDVTKHHLKKLHIPLEYQTLRSNCSTLKYL